MPARVSGLGVYSQSGKVGRWFTEIGAWRKTSSNFKFGRLCFNSSKFHVFQTTFGCKARKDALPQVLAGFITRQIRLATSKANADPSDRSERCLLSPMILQISPFSNTWRLIVVISGVISRVSILIILIRGLITRL